MELRGKLCSIHRHEGGEESSTHTHTMTHQHIYLFTALQYTHLIVQYVHMYCIYGMLFMLPEFNSVRSIEFFCQGEGWEQLLMENNSSLVHACLHISHKLKGNFLEGELSRGLARDLPPSVQIPIPCTLC